MLNELFKRKHNLWLKLLYGSVMVQNGESARMLDSFARIEFRHLRWLADEIISQYRNFDYENATDGTPFPKMFDFEGEMPHIECEFPEFIDGMKDDLKVLVTLYENDFIYTNRFRSDEGFFIHRIEKVQESRGFEAHDSFKKDVGEIAKNFNIDPDEAVFVKDSLEYLLDKEYASVISFFYINAHLENKAYAEILSDLTYESLSHMKYYAILMSMLGILKTPSKVKKDEYMINNLAKFLDKNIEDELEEIKEMESISARAKIDEFKNLLRFIEEQEKHHIMMLKRIRDAL